MTKNQKLLSECYEELKQDILIYTVKELADKYDVSRDYITIYIKQNDELYALYKSNKRKKNLEGRNENKKKKFKDTRNGVQLFTKRLEKKGVIELAEAVIVRAVKDRDIYFFQSERFDFWQQYTLSQKSKDYYLNCIRQLS